MIGSILILPSHGENRGSSPLGSARYFNLLVNKATTTVQLLSSFKHQGWARLGGYGGCGMAFHAASARTGDLAERCPHRLLSDQIGGPIARTTVHCARLSASPTAARVPQVAIPPRCQVWRYLAPGSGKDIVAVPPSRQDVARSGSTTSALGH